MEIARLFGIPVKLHWTFTVALIVVVLANMHSAPQLMLWLTIVGLLFAAVLIHEFGHALAARKVGLRVESILLMPLGGLTYMEEARRPRDEILVTAAGPAINLALALALLPAALLTWPAAGQPPGIVHLIFELNLILGVFNLLPAFPMDGGRILRAALEKRMGRVGATSVAARIGSVLALGMVIWAFAAPMYLMLIVAAWIWFVGRMELQRAVAMDHLRKLQEAGLPAGRIPPELLAMLQMMGMGPGGRGASPFGAPGPGPQAQAGPGNGHGRPGAAPSLDEVLGAGFWERLHKAGGPPPPGAAPAYDTEDNDEPRRVEVEVLSARPNRPDGASQPDQPSRLSDSGTSGATPADGDPDR